MTLLALKKEDSKSTDNETIFNCSREELLNLLKQNDFGRAANYRMIVAIPPEREKSKGGIIFTKDNSTTEQTKTSIGRILSLGSTVGAGELLKDCRDLKVGDYVEFNFYAAGLPRLKHGVLIKNLVDDQIEAFVEDPNSHTRLYDYAGGS